MDVERQDEYEFKRQRLEEYKKRLEGAIWSLEDNSENLIGLLKEAELHKKVIELGIQKVKEMETELAVFRDEYEAFTEDLRHNEELINTFATRSGRKRDIQNRLVGLNSELDDVYDKIEKLKKCGA